MKQLKPIMIVGTCSDAGKSVINAGICRILKQDGYSPAPYKAQNMSLNSYATPEGLEIGRAQATQAEACGIPCHSDMNPVLLKPTGEMVSQVVLNGKPIGNRSAYEYFRSEDSNVLFDAAYAAFERLSQRFSPIVLEGAGSISELNLKKRDIVNMRMAIRTGADVYLVSDIDRGGVIGSVYGSIMLLDEEERKHIKGIIINKFRGDITLFDDGRKIIEDLTGVPVVGVVPYFRDIYVEEEDSVVLEQKKRTAMAGKVNVAVVLLNQMSNFTDFDALQHDGRVNLFYSDQSSEIQKADIVILPGSKSTLKDLKGLQTKGLDKLIKSMHANGKTVIGICGGYQMLGKSINDPEGIEGSIKQLNGLDLLPVETTITDEKQTVQTRFQFLDKQDWCEGYEIHMGQTKVLDEAPFLLTLDDGSQEGVYKSERCWGSYMHGILDNQVVINQLLEPYANATESGMSYKEFKDKEYDKLADHLRANLDIDYMYRTMHGEEKK
ncbi:cobyric acid synthase [Carboxylicivirga sp. N1Y90]|uniref:cobyric acid synthase n=1 Tax=Carboxylicivirga fragile TaxID=3417571 RepID=UPI003D3387B9|nr:cobyric acid synthase [Marinilabiliaceae bacterium N1Y90]